MNVKPIIPLMPEHRKLDHLPARQRRNVVPAENCRTCGKKTSERKPFCEDHLENLPAAGAVMAQIRRDEKADAKAAKGGAIGVSNRRLQLVLKFIRGYKAVSPSRISMELDMTEAAALAYCKKLESMGLAVIRLSWDKRTQVWPVGRYAMKARAG